ncbi:chitobiosyldiphosphodolichol beta-mannosyltransferase [Tribolium madens]|uniref:chitobiosyldiphosphodolichol beta-mannosyltransferase n=1 Tax=Tribolium madens TaxID=41895 RepID=UPI001CF71F08|nr:chitobiosyldiphosphodolichol beta-mannosyltransferase [Tribolium madens]
MDKTSKNKSVKVVVLGDIGRSPRMQYHCMSLSEMGHRVDVIAYGDTEPLASIKADPFIFYHYLLPVPQLPIKLLNYAFKTVMQAINLLFLLFITTKSDILIMQNPPAIPAMVICWLYTRIVNAKFVIDWHNYAHTIMALNIGESNPLVQITKKVEVVIGHRADHNFCVTKAMKDDLQRNWDIKATTLYDRPPIIFKPITLEEKHKFILECGNKYHKIFLDEHVNSTVFTEETEEGIKLKTRRPGLLVSSTSWTEDEDFSILLTALQEYEKQCEEGNPRNLPKLICVITGKGPLKDYYLDRISLLTWNYVAIITPWLDAEDYPKILASADLGVSLHTSSSGLDLPMKVVDMFGCGLPVCAFDFKCLNELVKNGENSFIFKSSEELSKQILDWFENFPNKANQKRTVAKFKTELEAFQNLRWKENWEVVASPVFK